MFLKHFEDFLGARAMFSAQDVENLGVAMSCWTSWPVAAWDAATLWSQQYSHIQKSDGAGTQLSGVTQVKVADQSRVYGVLNVE